MGLAQKLIELLGLNMAADGIQNTDQGKSFQQEYVDPAMQAGANFLSRLIPEAAAATNPAPVEDRTQPAPTMEQVFNTPPPYNPRPSSALPEGRSKPLLPGLTEPVYLEGTTTLPQEAQALQDQTTAQSPSMQGFAQQAAIPAKQPNPAAMPLMQSAKGMLSEVDPSKPVPAVLASQDDIMLGAIGTVGNSAFKQGAQGQGQKDPTFFENVGGALKDFFGDERKMLIMTSAFNTLRYQPDAQLEAGIQKRLATLDANRMKTQTVQQLMKTGTPEALQAAEAIRLGIDPKVAIKRMQEYGEFEMVTGAQLMAEKLLPPGSDPKKVYNRNKRTGKITATGGGDTIMNMGSQDSLRKPLFAMQDKYVQEGLAARDALSGLNRINNLLSTTGTGQFEANKQVVREWMDAFGISGFDEQQYQDMQSLQAAFNEAVAQELRNNKGPQTDFDAIFAQSYKGTTRLSPEANREINAFARSKQEGVNMFGQIANNIMSTDPDAERKMRQINTMRLRFQNVAYLPNGQKMFFTDFMNDPENRGMEPMEMMASWVATTEKLMTQYK